jgi:hypothetical protein
MRKFYDAEKVVKKILKDLPITRGSDNLLYIRYWQIVAPEVSFIDFFKEPSKYNGATFKHIERCRRRIQEKHPELKSVKVAEFRFEQETEFKQYGLGMME